jgi:hypothetical protein
MHVLLNARVSMFRKTNLHEIPAKRLGYLSGTIKRHKSRSPEKKGTSFQDCSGKEIDPDHLSRVSSRFSE